MDSGLRFAAIDIGSNAIRLLFSRIIEKENDNPFFIKESLIRMPLRLGNDAFKAGIISEKNCDNFLEVYDAMHDLKFVNKIINNTKETILSCDELRLNNFLDDILSKIRENSNSKTSKNKKNNFSIIQLKYKNYIRPLENLEWFKDAVKDKVKKIINYKTRGKRII